MEVGAGLSGLVALFANRDQAELSCLDVKVGLLFRRNRIEMRC